MAHVKVYSRWIHSQLNCGKLLTINLSVKSFLSPLLTFPFGISNNAHTDTGNCDARVLGGQQIPIRPL